MNAPSRSGSGLGKAVLAAIGLRLALVPVLMGVNRIAFAARPKLHTLGTIVQAENVLRGVMTLVVAVLFMIWVRSELVALRAVGIQTRTTPLMAILGWFIPFGNFVLPLLGAREVYKLRLPRASAALPVLWWLAYLASMVTNNMRLPFPVASVVTLVAFGAWFAMVWNVVMATPEPSFAAAFPPPQPPQPYYAPPPR